MLIPRIQTEHSDPVLFSRKLLKSLGVANQYALLIVADLPNGLNIQVAFFLHQLSEDINLIQSNNSCFALLVPVRTILLWRIPLHLDPGEQPNELPAGMLVALMCVAQLTTVLLSRSHDHFCVLL